MCTGLNYTALRIPRMRRAIDLPDGDGWRAPVVNKHLFNVSTEAPSVISTDSPSPRLVLERITSGVSSSVSGRQTRPRAAQQKLRVAFTVTFRVQHVERPGCNPEKGHA